MKINRASYLSFNSVFPVPPLLGALTAVAFAAAVVLVLLLMLILSVAVIGMQALYFDLFYCGCVYVLVYCLYILLFTEL